jgi:hypothetical protein
MESILTDSDRSLRKLNQDLATLRENSDRSPADAIAYQEGSARIEDQIDVIYNEFNRTFIATQERFEGK